MNASTKKLQKKERNWWAEQFDITYKDAVEMSRTGYSEEKSWYKMRHDKKAAKKRGEF